MKIAFLENGELKVLEGEDQPVFVILGEYDKKNIKDMGKDGSVYCSYPDDDSYKEHVIRSYLTTLKAIKI